MGRLNINLQRLFFIALAILALAFALLCRFKGKIKLRAVALLGDVLRYVCLQGFVSLVFLGVYVLYVKNGQAPKLADIGVAMIPFSVLVFWAAWRFGALSASRISLLSPLAYSLFLLWRFFTFDGALGHFVYVLLNPIYGFIGSELLNSSLRGLAAVGALLPFACAALGYGLALKGIDKRTKMCNNK